MDALTRRMIGRMRARRHVAPELADA